MLPIPRSITIYVEVIYDNTENNPNNPFSPPRLISEKNGSMKTTDEMFQLILRYIKYLKRDEEIGLEEDIFEKMKIQQKKTIIAFDFDGTITQTDMFFLVIFHFNSLINLITKTPLAIFILIRHKLGLLSNSIAKEQIFGLYFKGWSQLEFNNKCLQFAELIEKNLNIEFKKVIKNLQNHNNEIIIVSASASNWIEPWARKYNFKQVISTEISVDKDNKLTGKFSTPNCINQHKVERILKAYPNREEYYLVAYGDSSGDKELLEFADESYLNFKKTK